MALSNAIDTQIHIIGLGVAEQAQFSQTAQSALQTIDAVIGSKRQLETMTLLLKQKANQPELHLLPKLTDLPALIDQYQGKSVAVLASGDPLHYGIGRWFSQNMAHHKLCFYPAISSIQQACHYLGLSLQDVSVLSLHGRPFEKIRSHLKNHQTTVVLTDKNSQPQQLAEACLEAGFERSTLTVCENLGYECQQIRQFSAHQLAFDKYLNVDPLHVTVIQTLGHGGLLPEFPGFPDDHFITGCVPGKGMISKRETRLSILSLMQPGNDDIIWDIGAGCGGVSVELAYWNQGLTVYAIEHHTDRLHFLNINRSRFGVVSNLHIIEGRAPQCLSPLPLPNKIFIGGSDGELKRLLELAWNILPANGILVATAVMDTTRQQLNEFAEVLEDQQVESVEISVKRGQLNQGKLAYTRKLPVCIFKFTKTGGTK